MAESTEYKQQILDNKQHIVEELPLIKCSSHQNSKVVAINLNSEFDNVLVCTKCISSNRLNGENLIDIESIFSKSPNEIITNWPPLEDQQIEQQLNSNDVIEKIVQRYDTLKNKIQETLVIHQKKLLNHVNLMEDQRENVLKLYNHISEKDEIKKQFIKNQNNVKELETYLKMLISSKQKQSYDNEKSLKNSLETLTRLQLRLQFDYIDNLSNEIFNKLKLIDFLNPHLQIEEQFQIKDKIDEETEIKDEELTSKVNKIVDLINDKTKFCSSKFIINLKDVLSLNKQIFTQLDVNDSLIKDQEQMYVENLQQIGFDKLQNITDYPINKKRLVTPTNKNYQINQSKFFEQSLIMMNHLFQSNENNNVFEQFQNIAQKYNQSDSNISDQNSKKGDLLQNIGLIKSNYGNPNCMYFQKMDLNQFMIECHSFFRLSYRGQVIVNEQIMPRNKYQIQIQIHSCNNDGFIMLGLIPISQKEELGSKSKLSISSSECGHGIDKVDKGIHISNLVNYERTITFQICLNEKIFRCLSIEDNKRHINSLCDWNSIKPNEQYYFYTALYLNQKLRIKEFRTVDLFDEW